MFFSIRDDKSAVDRLRITDLRPQHFPVVFQVYDHVAVVAAALFLGWELHIITVFIPQSTVVIRRDSEIFIFKQELDRLASEDLRGNNSCDRTPCFGNIRFAALSVELLANPFCRSFPVFAK